MTLALDITRFIAISSAAALIADGLHRCLAYIRRLIGGTSVAAERADAQGRCLSVTLPPAVSTRIADVPERGGAQANAGTCGPESLMGGDPFTVTGGKVYLTGPYKGAPLSLLVPVPAKAGPFNLGTIISRVKIYIDFYTAQVTLAPQTFPHIIDGIPLQLKHINKNINGVGGPPLMFNPTNCTPMAVTG